MTTTTTTLPIARIQVNADTQSRARIDVQIVAEYAESMRLGKKFPPVIVFRDGRDHILADGFHRVRAARKVGLSKIMAEIRVGGRIDALKYSLGANHRHGLRRTNADKHHAVGLALGEFDSWSDRALADICGVSQPFVGNIRRQLITVISSKRLGKDGRSRRMPVTGTSSGGLNGSEVNEVNDQFHQEAMELGHQFKALQDTVKKIVLRYPDHRQFVRGVIEKVRDDLLFMSRDLGVE